MKRFLIILGFIAMFLLGACATTQASADQTHPLKIWKQNENGCANTWCVEDEDTGVNYVVVTTYQYDSDSLSIAITPRLNADGSLYVTP